MARGETRGDRPDHGGVALDATDDQIRGSSLLVLGRIIGMLIGLVAQVWMVRLLPRPEFGAFAYGLAFVTAGRSFVALGQKRAVPRFLSIYEERGDRGRLLGTLLGEVAGMVLLGAGLLAGLWLMPERVLSNLIDSDLAIRVLLVMAALAPIEAVDEVFASALAVLSKPSAIFVRKYLAGPVLKVVAVALTALLSAGVYFLAGAWVMAGLAGVLLYVGLLLPELRRRGYFDGLRWSDLRFPVKDLLGFGVPLLTNDLLQISMSTLSVAILGYVGGASEVAGFRAVYPVARINHVLLWNFTTLFIPLVSRQFARNDRLGIENAYERTALWVAVGTFPVFALTVPLADQVAITLFGEQYSDAGAILAAMSLGMYFNAMLGLNTVTLQVMGLVKFVVWVNVAAAVLNLGLNLALAPLLGGLGVAIAISITYLFLNGANQWRLARELQMPFFGTGVLVPYVTIALAGGVLLAIDVLFHLHIVLLVVLAVVASIGVLAFNYRRIGISKTFPELLRIPLVRRLDRWLGGSEEEEVAVP